MDSMAVLRSGSIVTVVVVVLVVDVVKSLIWAYPSHAIGVLCFVGAKRAVDKVDSASFVVEESKSLPR
jgi:hypothetical protein